jgi:sulfur-oxidizing protein SoxY
MDRPMNDRRLSRRAALGATLALAAAPWPALAQESPAVEAAIRDLIGRREPEEGGMALRLPPVAEHGGQVPLTVTVDSPQTAERHVTAIHILATRNPTPGVASFRLTPHLARAEVQTRIRLAADQRILAIVEFSDGTLRRASAETRVGQGGCLT